MKKNLIALAGLTMAATALPAQVQPTVQQFQQPGVIGNIGPLVPRRTGGFGALVTGSPVSAKEVSKTVQTLGDGTQLENSNTARFYRDSLGRTRTESPDGGNITIMDPVAGVRLQLDATAKTAVRIPMPGSGVAPGVPGGGVPGGRGRSMSANPSENGQDISAALDKLKIAAAGLADEAKAKMQAEAAARGPAPHREDLGFHSTNGVMAQGTRSTMTIPQGQIGNNRDIHVVNEGWYSKDLQMMVKTVNSDPRFGVTTYELTDIVQAEPDAALFQVPAGFTLTEAAGRGGRMGPGR
jgi:hypothetical protein